MEILIAVSLVTILFIVLGINGGGHVKDFPKSSPPKPPKGQG